MLDEQKTGCASNCYQMCCNNKMVDQVELFKKHLIDNDPTKEDEILSTTTFIEEEE
jgi:hypothetical protein